MKKALLLLKEGICGINECSKMYGISQPTLTRHLLSKYKYAKYGVKVIGRSTSLPPEVEEDLVKHIQMLEGMMFGITRKDLMQLGYQFVEANNLLHAFSKTKRMAGKDLYNAFMKRHPNLSLRQTEPTSIARASGFNITDLNGFYDKLQNILDLHSL